MTNVAHYIETSQLVVSGLKDLQLTGQGKLYINQSLCPYYRVLWSKSKSLHSMGKIYSYYVSNGTVKIKIQETSKPLSIMHISHLDKLPDVRF